MLGKDLYSIKMKDLKGKGSLCELNSPCACNILLFGAKGVGKSSVIVALSTDDDVEDVVILNENHELIPTRNYTSYSLTDEITVYDTWGWRMKRNYRKKEFEMLIDGRIKEDMSEKGIIPSIAMNYRKIDIVLFVVDVRTDETILNEMKPFVRIAMERGLGVFFVITKIDKLASTQTTPSAPELYLKSCKSKVTEIANKIKKICDCDRTFPIFRYSLDRERNELIRNLKIPLIKAIEEHIQKINERKQNKEVKEEDDEEKNAIDELLTSTFGVGSPEKERNKEDEVGRLPVSSSFSSLDENSQIFSVILKKYGSPESSPRNPTSSKKLGSPPASLGELNALDELMGMSGFVSDEFGPNTPATLEEMADFCEIIRSPGGNIVKISCGGQAKKK